MKRLVLSAITLCTLAAPVLASAAVTKTALVKNGPDADKYVIAVVGDGYDDGDMATYRSDVQSKIIEGMFQQDETLKKYRSSFNIYRVDAESEDSGISEWNMRQDNSLPGCDGTVRDPDCWEQDPSMPQTTHDTVLGYVATNEWALCWLYWVVSAQDTQNRLNDVLAEANIVPDKTIILVNTSRLVGCSGGNAFVANRSTAATTFIHEFGHLIPGLHDEYSKAVMGAYTGGTFNNRNCSTVVDDDNVVWSSFLTEDIPTVWDPSDMDADSSVGMFEGCKTHTTGIYRPVHNCRMNGNINQFCPVCRAEWEKAVGDEMDDPKDYTDFANIAGAMCNGVGTTLTYTTAAAAGNNATSAKWAVCPFRRINDGSWTNRFFGRAWVKDRSSSEDVCCRVRTRNPGGATKDGPSVCSSGNSSTPQDLYLDFPKVYDNYTWSHVEVLCKLPAKSGSTRSEVLTYRVGQQRF